MLTLFKDAGWLFMTKIRRFKTAGLSRRLISAAL